MLVFEVSQSTCARSWVHGASAAAKNRLLACGGELLSWLLQAQRARNDAARQAQSHQHTNLESASASAAAVANACARALWWGNCVECLAKLV